MLCSKLESFLLSCPSEKDCFLYPLSQYYPIILLLRGKTWSGGYNCYISYHEWFWACLFSKNYFFFWVMSVHIFCHFLIRLSDYFLLICRNFLLILESKLWPLIWITKIFSVCLLISLFRVFWIKKFIYIFMYLIYQSFLFTASVLKYIRCISYSVFIFKK